MLWPCKWCHSAICASDWLPMSAVAQDRGRRVLWLDLKHSLRQVSVCNGSCVTLGKEERKEELKCKKKAKEWKWARLERVKKKQELNIKYGAKKAKDESSDEAKQRWENEYWFKEIKNDQKTVNECVNVKKLENKRKEWKSKEWEKLNWAKEWSTKLEDEKEDERIRKKEQRN